MNTKSGLERLKVYIERCLIARENITVAKIVSKMEELIAEEKAQESGAISCRQGEWDEFKAWKARKKDSKQKSLEMVALELACRSYVYSSCMEICYNCEGQVDFDKCVAIEKERFLKSAKEKMK